MRNSFLLLLAFFVFPDCNKTDSPEPATSQATLSDATCTQIAKKQNAAGGGASTLALAGGVGGGFIAEATAALASKIKTPWLQIVQEPDSYTINPYRERVHFTFQTASGMPLCPYSAYAQSFADQLRISETMTKSVPANTAAPDPEALLQPELAQSLERLYEKATLSLSDTQKAQILAKVQSNTQGGFSATPCLAWVEGQWSKAWDVEFMSNAPSNGGFSEAETETDTASFEGLPLADSGGSAPHRYTGVATDAHALSIHARFFALTGSVSTTEMSQAFPASVTVASRSLANMSDGGTLCNPDFATVYDNGQARAYSPNGVFQLTQLGTYSLSDFLSRQGAYQAEASLFTNANNMLAYFKTIGADASLIKDQIQVVLVTGSDAQSKNTAYFMPKTSTTPAGIFVGPGDGSSLVYLQFSQWVAAHELAHHVIYQFLTQVVRGEPSSVIHEGIADLFVMLRLGDPCFGQGLCPAGGRVCNSQQCLRNADKGLKFGDPNFPTEYHQVSQVISGMGWTLAQSLGALPTAKLVYLAVSFFDPAADYKNLIESLMMADKAMYGGTHACQIYQNAVDYGFKPSLGKLSCQKYAAAAALR